MHISLLVALSSVCSVLAVPTANVPISKHAGPVNSGSYIVKLKPGASKSTHLARLFSIATGSKLDYDYANVFNGYAAHLEGKALEHVRQSSDVDAIFEDGIVHVNIDAQADLARRSRPVESESLQFSKRVNGSSVDIYQIGTGIYLQHTQFGGRALWGATFGGYAGMTDGNGGSTHSAALAVGSTYGVANKAKIYAVKAISDAGSGSTSDIIAAINWIISAVAASGRPSIAYTGIGGPASTALDSAVTNAVSKGIHFVVTAGNSNVDASTTSPARVAAAITVGAVDAAGKRASYSNYGTVVDVYYYGTSALSAWIGSPTATNTLSGTGVAVARVVGILANVIDTYGNSSPADLQAALKSHARLVGGILIAQPW